MSHTSRTRSAAAGVRAAGKHAEGLLGATASNAAVATKNRHNSSVVQQAAMQQSLQSADTAAKPALLKQQLALAHQGSIDENVNTQSDNTVEPSAPKPAAGADSSQPLPGTHAARTRSLPPKPNSAKTRSAKQAATRLVQTAVRAVPEEPALPAVNPLSTTLAGLAQGLVASRNINSISDAAEAVPEQIDLDFDFSNDSEDSDFQPDNEPAAAAEEVIDLSQEDRLDVVEQADGLVSIRSPPQVAAAAVASAADASDDDEEEFQQLGGKRSQPAPTAAKGVLMCSALPTVPVIIRRQAALIWTAALHPCVLALCGPALTQDSVEYDQHKKVPAACVGVCGSSITCLQAQQRRGRLQLARQQKLLWMQPWRLLILSRRQLTRQPRRQQRQQPERQKLLPKAKARRQLIVLAAIPMSGGLLSLQVMRKLTRKH